MSILQAWGMRKRPAESTARFILEADLRGIDSHGLSMLPHYESMVRDREIEAGARPHLVRRGTTTALVDGKSGFGHQVALFAMKLATEMAVENQVGVVSASNSHHFGAAGPYAEIAARAGLVGMVTTTGRIPVVLPTFGLDRMLGTNPFAFAAPAAGGGLVLLDMSTSVVAAHKVKAYAYSGNQLPGGWVVDEHGDPVTDAAMGKDLIFNSRSGGILPLGGLGVLHGGHKGYGLGLFAQVLAGALSGGTFSPLRKPEEKDNIGHLFLAINPTAFREPGAFQSDVAEMIDHIRASRRVDPDQPVLIPGDPEWTERRERMRCGIPLPAALIERLKEIAQRADCEFLIEECAETAPEEVRSTVSALRGLRARQRDSRNGR